MFNLYSKEKIINNYKKFYKIYKKQNIKKKEKIIKKINKNIFSLKENYIYKANVIKKIKKYILVYIDNNKYENLISIKEFKKKKIKKKIKILFLKNDYIKGNIVSYKEALKIIIWNKINKYYEKNKHLFVKIKNKIKGGYIVILKKYILGFLPNSHIIEKKNDLENKKIPIKIININYKKKNIIVSNKKYFLDLKFKKNIIKYKKNQIIKGNIIYITFYGLIININNIIKGVLYNRNLFFIKNKKFILNYFNFKKKYKFKILNINYNKTKIKLGLTRLIKKKIWRNIINKKFKIGQKIICHIYKLYDYGIITIIKKYNIKCLIYLSELNWLLQLTKPKKIFKIGEKIKCLIIDINYFDTKLILSVKRLYKNPWNKLKLKYKLNSFYEGVIQGINNLGDIYLLIDKSVEGIIKNINIYNYKIKKKYNAYFKIGNKIEFILLSFNEKKYIFNCGLKITKIVNYKIFFKKKYINYYKVLNEDVNYYYLILHNNIKINICLLKNNFSKNIKINNIVLAKVINYNFKINIIYVKLFNKNYNFNLKNINNKIFIKNI